MYTVSVIDHKGGVGKTTTALNEGIPIIMIMVTKTSIKPRQLCGR